MRDKRTPKLIERRLFGPHTCRIGLCGRDGTCAVALPCTFITGEPTWTTIFLCEKHASEHIAQGQPKRRTARRRASGVDERV